MIFENVTAALILLVNVILSYAVIEPAKTYDYQNCEYKWIDIWWNFNTESSKFGRQRFLAFVSNKSEISLKCKRRCIFEYGRVVRMFRSTFRGSNFVHHTPI